MGKVVRVSHEEEPEEAHVASFPDVAVMSSMLEGKPLSSCIVLVMNTEGSLSHYVDGVSIFEAVGMLESMKRSLLDEVMSDE